MKIEAYRDLISEGQRVAGVDYHSCTTGNEKRAWLKNAIRVRDELASAGNPRRTERDAAAHQQAHLRLCELIAATMQWSKEADASLQLLAFGAEYR